MTTRTERATTRRGRRLGRRGLVLPALLVGLVACGGDDVNGGRAGGGPDDALVDWMGQLCDAASQSVQSLPYPTATPEVATEADRQPLVDFLTATQAALSTAIEAADALPRPPTAAAADVAQAYRADLDELANRISEDVVLATRFPAAELRNIYIVDGVAVISFQPGGENMSEYLEGNAVLRRAHQQAPACSGDRTSTTTEAGPPTTTAGTPEEREAALLADIRETFADQPGGDQQVLGRVYDICAALDATDPDRFYPPENVDPARATSLVESLAGRSRTEVLESFGRVLGNPVTVGVMARLGAEHVCPEHSDAIEEFMASPSPPPRESTP
jgi:hypothetical protein